MGKVFAGPGEVLWDCSLPILMLSENSLLALAPRRSLILVVLVFSEHVYPWSVPYHHSAHAKALGQQNCSHEGSFHVSGTARVSV